jgi:hypothetical protein
MRDRAFSALNALGNTKEPRFARQYCSEQDGEKINHEETRPLQVFEEERKVCEKCEALNRWMEEMRFH